MLLLGSDWMTDSHLTFPLTVTFEFSTTDFNVMFEESAGSMGLHGVENDKDFLGGH